MTSKDAIEKLSILPRKVNLSQALKKEYAKVIDNYSADIIEQAVDYLIQTEFFFPVIALLKKTCDRFLSQKIEQEAKEREYKERKNTKTWIELAEASITNKQLAKDCCNLARTARRNKYVWRRGIRQLAQKYPDLSWKLP